MCKNVGEMVLNPKPDGTMSNHGANIVRNYSIIHQISWYMRGMIAGFGSVANRCLIDVINKTKFAKYAFAID